MIRVPGGGSDQSLSRATVWSAIIGVVGLIAAALIGARFGHDRADTQLKIFERQLDKRDERLEELEFQLSARERQLEEMREVVERQEKSVTELRRALEESQQPLKRADNGSESPTFQSTVPRAAADAEQPSSSLNSKAGPLPKFVSEAYVAEIQSVVRRGDAIIVDIIFDNLTNKTLSLGWHVGLGPEAFQRFFEAGPYDDVYLADDEGNRWFLETSEPSEFLFCRATVASGTKLHVQLRFRAQKSSASRQFTLVARECAPNSARAVLVEHLRLGAA